MRLKEFKERTGLSTKTVQKLYDKKLLPSATKRAERKENGHRYFTEEDVRWVKDRTLKGFKRNNPDIRDKENKKYYLLYNRYRDCLQ